MNKLKVSSLIISCVFLAGFAQVASAATITRSFTGNDCSGYFGSGFDSCDIFVNDNGVDIKLSPVIAKYDNNLSNPQINLGGYPSFDGSEITFSNPVTDNKTGTWSYTQGTDDPGIKFVVAKAGNGFDLFWDVADSALLAGGACSGADTYTLACLSIAQELTTGTWATPGNKELSHITFYNTKPPHVVPVPAAAWLFLSGFGALRILGKRKQS